MHTILVVDDCADYREFLETVLKRHGCRTVSRDSGPSALSALGELPVDGIIVDLVMAGMDGLELIRAIRRQHGHLPILLLTGGCIGLRNPYVNAALALGADMAACKGGGEVESIRGLLDLVAASGPAPRAGAAQSVPA